MDKLFIESLFSKLKNPARVCVKLFDNRYFVIASADNTNDTMGWFHINSNMVEDAVLKEGATWCYLFETAPKHTPCIYMFVGKGLSKEKLEEELREIRETLPEGRNFYYEDGSFSSIDVDQYDDSASVLEKELTRVAGDVFKVYEP